MYAMMAINSKRKYEKLALKFMVHILQNTQNLVISWLSGHVAQLVEQR